MKSLLKSSQKSALAITLEWFKLHNLRILIKSGKQTSAQEDQKRKLKCKRNSVNLLTKQIFILKYLCLRLYRKTLFMLTASDNYSSSFLDAIAKLTRKNQTG